MVVLLLTMATAGGVGAEWNESFLIRQVLLKDYDKVVRPVKDSTQPVYLSMSIGIKSFIELDMKKQTLVSFGWLTVNWFDEYLTWDPIEHPVTSVHLTTDMVWRPELVVFNTISQLDELEDQKMKVIVNHDGKITWYPGGLFQTFCAIDISHYPLDTQTCSVDLIPWSLDNSFLNGTFNEPAFEITATENHPEWELVGTQTSYTLRQTNYWVISFKFMLRRKILFYVVNVIMPIVLLSLMNCLVFLLPVESGEKMTVSVTVFLSFAVFMSLINDSLPQNSDSLCLFSAYVAVQMFLSVCSIVMAAVIVFIFDQDKSHSALSAISAPSPTQKTTSEFSTPYDDLSTLMTSTTSDTTTTTASTAKSSGSNSAADTATSPNATDEKMLSRSKGKKSLSACSAWRWIMRVSSMTPMERKQFSRALDKACFVLTVTINVISSLVFIVLMTLS
ncbi:hypothetical protein BaRGS_00014897 [Batillaria attramentaria]|uniref:Uncharacterized protein n=1 Tax=Batillaria attramentaria TaxID=370345 RepID=A0ABD0L3B3_9CAEN